MGLVTAVGPLVVRGDRWMLPDGSRGVVYQDAAQQAAMMGAGVVLVVDQPPAQLWGSNAEAEVIGEVTAAAWKAAGLRGKPRPWRYRVSVPGGVPVVLVVLVHDVERKAGPFHGASGTEAAAVLRVLAAEEHLGVPWGHSVGRTAEHLVLATHPRHRGGVQLDRSPDVPEPARSPGVEQPWAAWRRPLTDEEAGRAYVHTFDGNSAFLGAWQTTDLGLGKCSRWTGDEAALSRAGVWRVALPAGWSEPATLPAIAPRLTDGAGWVMTPTLTRLREYAAGKGWPELLPAEGWVWARQSRFLRKAGERLRDTRAAALRAQTAAEAAIAGALADEQLDAAVLALEVSCRVESGVKELYRVLNGRLASTDPYIAAGWRRPDWSNALRAAFRCALHRKLCALGAHPFAVATDALAFATDEADPAVFAASIGLRLGDGLGTFRATGSAPLPALVDQLGARVSVFRLVERGGRPAVAA